MKTPALVLLGLFLSTTVWGVDRFVAVFGTDSGDCLFEGLPCASIGYAVSVSASGDVIYVRAGSYEENILNELLQSKKPSAIPKTKGGEKLLLSFYITLTAGNNSLNYLESGNNFFQSRLNSGEPKSVRFEYL